MLRGSKRIVKKLRVDCRHGAILGPKKVQKARALDFKFGFIYSFTKFQRKLIQSLEVYAFLRRCRLSQLEYRRSRQEKILSRAVAFMVLLQSKNFCRWHEFLKKRRRVRRVSSWWAKRLKVLIYLQKAKKHFMKKQLVRTVAWKRRNRRARLSFNRLLIKFIALKKLKPKFGYYLIKKYNKKVFKTKKKLSSLLFGRKNKKPLYNKKKFTPRSPKISKTFIFFKHLVNQTIRRGKKKKALNLIINEFCRIRRRLKKSRPTRTYLGAIMKKLNPYFTLRKHAIGRRVYIMPLPLVGRKKLAAISRLFLRAVSRRSEVSFRRRLEEELKDFFTKSKKPASLKLKRDLIKTAVDNKNNTRFLYRRWPHRR